MAELFKNDNVDPVDNEATILQALGLMNSSGIDASTAPLRGNTLGAVLDSPFLDTAGRIEVLYLSTLSRKPTKDESARFVKFVEAGGTHSDFEAQDGQRLPATDHNRPDKIPRRQRRRPRRRFLGMLNSSEFLTKSLIGEAKRPMWTRRDWLRMAAGVSFCSASGWIEALAADTRRHPQRKRSCILLWMPGGPSQLDTFDPKPGHANGGPFKAIATSAPGVQISEHLPKLAKHMDRAAVVRSMFTKEGDHNRATTLMRTGYLPQGPIRYPSFGSLFSKELMEPASEMPAFVSIAPSNFFATGPGFLGPQFAPMVVGNGRDAAAAVQQTSPQMSQPEFGPPLRVENLDSPAGVTTTHAEARLGLLKDLDRDFLAHRPGVPVTSHLSAYERAVRLMRAKGSEAFDLDEEPRELRLKYGRNQFGQGCLLARRLVERGVPFVEVSLSGGQPAAGTRTSTTSRQSPA